MIRALTCFISAFSGGSHMTNTSWKIDDTDEMFGAVLAADLFAEARAGVFPAPGPETVTGTSGPDVIRTGGGNDYIQGLSGRDRIYGGAAGDLISGGTGRDRLYGGRAADTLYGGGGNDKMYGGNGHDWLIGSKGKDGLFGGEGDDFFNDWRGNNKMFGGDGDDLIRGRGTMAGGAGDDSLDSSDAENSDAFDFRVPDGETGGRDTVYNYSLDRTGTLTAGRDSIIVDTDVNVAVDFVVGLDGVQMVLTRGTQEVATVIFDGPNPADIGLAEQNLILQGLLDDIVRL
jgi:Ca2+-binding RTX toxin-like protein